MAIRRLPALLVNQIAAGEVIERPASVVKECIENALDADARRITVEIEQGGKELIRIADDGGGIALDELELAIAPHATSKLENADDLQAIATLGFRGEALASIASVSRLSVLSRAAHADSAGVIECEGDSVQPVRPASRPVGTTITVRNLFWNTPARRKFLKTDETEAARIREVLENLAISHPSTAFSYVVNGKTVLDLAATGDARRRVLEVIGDELSEEVLEVTWNSGAGDSHHPPTVDAIAGVRTGDSGGAALWGLAGKPSIARGTSRHQRTFLNGRMISDRVVSHALKEAFRGLIDPGRHPTAVLLLEVEPTQVDVNVHPTKAEVRFRNSASIHSMVMNAVRTALRKADLTPALELAPADPWSSPAWGSSRWDIMGPTAAPSPNLFPSSGSASPPDAANLARLSTDPQSGLAAFVEHFRALDPVQRSFVYSEVKQAIAQTSPELLSAEVVGERALADAATVHARNPESRDASTLSINGSGGMQVHESYIVAQDEQGIIIIDQHALHERVMFEKLKARLGDGPLESQRLLMPAIVPVDSRQREALSELSPLLNRLGIEAGEIGPGQVGVHAFTSLLIQRGVEPGEFLTQLLTHAFDKHLEKRDTEAALHEVLDMMACKAAVKAGDKLTPVEINELLRFRHHVERSSNCPHGRPTSLRLSLAELDRRFGRR